MGKISFTLDELNNFYNLLLNGNSWTKIGEITGQNKRIIQRELRANNFALPEKGKRYFCDENIFKEIDSNEKAYWAGFLAADGCISYSNGGTGTIALNISEKDEEQVKKFQSFTKSNYPIKHFIQTAGFSNNSKMVQYSIYSSTMAKDLEKIGIMPNKSLTLSPPALKEEYELSYILGYFDGDGSIYKFNSGTEWGINFVGTLEILTWINDKLNLTTTYSKRYETDKNNYYIRCGGVQKPYLILKKLYNNQETFLSRKKELFLELEQVVQNRNIL